MESVNEFCSSYNISLDKSLKLIYENNKDIYIPISIFNEELTPLESIVKYLKENCGMKYCEIGRVLGRDQRNIWGTYNRAAKKYSGEIRLRPIEFLIPVEHIKQSHLSVFECVVLFLKTNYELSLNDISKLMGKDNRTIWTIYHRAIEKNGK